MRKQRLTATVLAALLTLSAAPGAGAYTDITGSWAADVIEKAGQYGLMEGYPDGRFGVGDPMKRCEFAAVLTRMFGWETVTPDSPTYIDCTPNDWY